MATFQLVVIYDIDNDSTRDAIRDRIEKDFDMARIADSCYGVRIQFVGSMDGACTATYNAVLGDSTIAPSDVLVVMPLLNGYGQTPQDFRDWLGSPS